MDESEKRLEDYSLVFLKSVETLGIPKSVSFRYEDPNVYVGPRSDSVVHKRPPDEVVIFFRADKDQSFFEHAGSFWFLHGYADNGFYTRTICQRCLVADKITPYVEKLVGFANKEVLVKDVLPPFERTPNFPAFDIPDTGFKLVLSESKGLVRVVVAEIDRGFGNLDNLCSVARFEYEGRK
ncbi:hypothetical protein KY309_02220 [Candidatus Woesearchaeota archaeon]|nr:hypothetical protein [Candidatus Woesearchaeota archaeon]